MTSEEIKRADRTSNNSPNDYAMEVRHVFWLKEIAYQLAVFNEREAFRIYQEDQRRAGR